jgi:hypothetical protein
VLYAWLTVESWTCQRVLEGVQLLLYGSSTSWELVHDRTAPALITWQPAHVLYLLRLIMLVPNNMA